jgi:ribonucleoside-diphosphate reductase alpha chain
LVLHVKREDVDKPLEIEPAQMLARVAKGIASIEMQEVRTKWEAEFNWLLEDWKFVPGGRILTGAGTDQNLTYFNCYVIPSPKDSRGGIIASLGQMTEIMSRGGGVGMNISSLRPRHSYVKGVNGRSSGSVSWGGLFSFVTGLIEQGGSRRGALMLILNVWHPDIIDFINSKREMGKITNANISVGITDDFMEAVRKDADWQTCFPDTSDPAYNAEWDGDIAKWKANGHKVVVYQTQKAKKIWDAIVESAWASAEPGVFFIDRYNKMSNSWYYPPSRAPTHAVSRDFLLGVSATLGRSTSAVCRGQEGPVRGLGPCCAQRSSIPGQCHRRHSLLLRGKQEAAAFRAEDRAGDHGSCRHADQDGTSLRQ